MRTPFLGGHTVSRSKNLADNQCINLYASIVETKDGKDVGALYSTPGLKGLDTLGSGPIRGQINAAGDLILVSGHEVYGISGKDNTHTLLGTIATYDGPVSLIYNDLDQVALFDGDQGYLFTGPVPTGGTPFVTTCDCANSNANSPPGVLLYVAGSSCDVLGFPLTTNGSTAPTIDIEGSNTQLTGPTGNPESLTWAVAVDASENIYVISSVQTVAFPSTFQTSILIWDAGSTGNVAPSRQVTGAATQLDSNNVNVGTGVNFAMGICLDDLRNIYACLCRNIILKFETGANGNATGATFVTLGASEELTSLFFDRTRQWIWTLSKQTGGNQKILAFDLNGTQQRSITGNVTQLSQPQQIYLGPDQSIYVADMGNGQINVYDKDASGNAAPVRTFTTPNMGSNGLGGVAVDSAGKAYCSVFRYGSTPNLIEVAAAGASGAVPAIQTMSAPQLGAISADGTPTSPLQLFIG